MSHRRHHTCAWCGPTEIPYAEVQPCKEHKLCRADARGGCPVCAYQRATQPPEFSGLFEQQEQQRVRVPDVSDDQQANVTNVLAVGAGADAPVCGTEGGSAVKQKTKAVAKPVKKAKGKRK